MPFIRSASSKSDVLTSSRFSIAGNSVPFRARTTGTPSTSFSAERLREVTKVTA